MVPLPEIEGAVVDVNFAPNATGHPKLYIHSTTITIVSLKCLVLLRGVKNVSCYIVIVYACDYFLLLRHALSDEVGSMCVLAKLCQNGLQCQNRLPVPIIPSNRCCNCEMRLN